MEKDREFNNSGTPHERYAYTPSQRYSKERTTNTFANPKEDLLVKDSKYDTLFNGKPPNRMIFEEPPINAPHKLIPTRGNNRNSNLDDALIKSVPSNNTYGSSLNEMPINKG